MSDAWTIGKRLKVTGTFPDVDPSEGQAEDAASTGIREQNSGICINYVCPALPTRYLSAFIVGLPSKELPIRAA